MKSMIEQVLKQMPFTPPDTITAFSSSGIAMFKPQVVLAAQTAFDCYEFVIPFDRFPEILIEDTRLMPENNKVFTVNPGQLHGGMIRKHEQHKYIPIFINKVFLQEMCRSIFGKSEVFFENSSFTVNNHLFHQLELFMEEYVVRQPGYEFMLESLSIEIAINLLRHIKNNFSALQPGNNYHDNESVTRVIEYLREHYNADFSSEDIAKLANLSPYHFIRVFKVYTGKTPYEYLIDIKIEKAKEMLLSKHRTITEVCFLCGFKNLSHFTTVFRKKTGVQPSQYRKEILGV